MRISRPEQIQLLSRRYSNLMKQRKLKAAGMIYVRLRELVTKQLRAEIRRGPARSINQSRACMEIERLRAVLSAIAIHHIDGNPNNNSPENLRLVDIRENRGKS